MQNWHREVLFEAPVESVWEMVGDPARYPEWAANVISVTGLAEVAEDAWYTQVTTSPLGTKVTTRFEIEKLDELHEITLRCQTSGYYSRWVLTEAQDQTFARLELGIEPTAPIYRFVFGVAGRRYLRRIGDATVDGLRDTLRR